jgi:flagellar basal-body rod protein FlgF
MNVSLYQAASALSASARWQEVVSENLASASVPGFKKQQLSFAAIQAGMIPAQNGTTPVAIPRATASTSFQAGEAKFTGVNTDVAIDGTGFFQVQLPNGSNAYTRDGEFQVNAQGQLVTKQGYAVMGDGGPIQMDPSNPAPLSVSPTGEVSQGSDVKGRIKVVEFNQPGLLTGIGAGCFVATNPQLQSTPAQSSTVRQGFLESANMAPTTEMGSLITAMRSFEANQKVMQMQDERMGKVITDLGNPS